MKASSQMHHLVTASFRPVNVDFDQLVIDGEFYIFALMPTDTPDTLPA
jgi:hypothetical protein